MAVFSQYIAVFGGVEDEIVECFKQGGGVPYEKFPRFHAVMAEDSGQSVLSSLESHVLPARAGADRAACQRHPHAGCRLRQWPHHQSTGRPVPEQPVYGDGSSPEAIGEARSEAAQQGLQNTEFIVRDLSDFHETAEPEAFDFITTFDAIHDQAKPLNVLKASIAPSRPMACT